MTIAPAAWFRRHCPVRAMRAEEDWTWEVRSDDGRVLDHAPVMRGEWLVREGISSATYSDAGFHAGHDAVPGYPGEYTRRSPPALELEPTGSGRRLFRSTRIRCTRSGRLLCLASMDAHLQAALLRVDDPDAAVHLAALGYEWGPPGIPCLRREIEARAAADGVAVPEWSGASGPLRETLVAAADPAFVTWLGEAGSPLPQPIKYSGLAARHGFHAPRFLLAGVEYTVVPGSPGRVWARRAA